MTQSIKELRACTGLSQRDFAAGYNIPLKTLQHWEAGDSQPAPYLLTLLAKAIPGSAENSFMKICYKKETYFYDEATKTFYDQKGNSFICKKSLEGVKMPNLALFLHSTFKAIYDEIRLFESDLKSEENSDILWEEFI